MQGIRSFAPTPADRSQPKTSGREHTRWAKRSKSASREEQYSTGSQYVAEQPAGTKEYSTFQDTKGTTGSTGQLEYQTESKFWDTSTSHPTWSREYTTGLKSVRETRVTAESGAETGSQY